MTADSCFSEFIEAGSANEATVDVACSSKRKLERALGEETFPEAPVAMPGNKERRSGDPVSFIVAATNASLNAEVGEEKTMGDDPATTPARTNFAKEPLTASMSCATDASCLRSELDWAYDTRELRVLKVLSGTLVVEVREALTTTCVRRRFVLFMMLKASTF